MTLLIVSLKLSQRSYDTREPWLKEVLLVTEDTSADSRIVDRLEEKMIQFEQDNPELSEAIHTLGMTINDYERILTESRSVEIQTSNSTGGALAP